MCTACVQKTASDVNISHVPQSVNSRATPTNPTDSEDLAVGFVGTHRGSCVHLTGLKITVSVVRFRPWAPLPKPLKRKNKKALSGAQKAGLFSMCICLYVDIMCTNGRK